MLAVGESSVKFNLVFSILLLLFGSMSSFSEDNLSVLTVKIKKITPVKGSLKIALVDKETKIESKDDLKGAVKVDNIDVTAKTMNYRFKKLPFGKYSFIVFHDENDNDELDLDLFDSPVEGFGYSNNPSIKKRKPSFKESAFEVNEKDQTINVQMQYF